RLVGGVTLPRILPATSTVVLIRLIEAFKIVDLPNVLKIGGPGTATESLTLHAYTIWRALDIGGSAAVAYMLLFVVTFVGITYVNLFRRRVTALPWGWHSTAGPTDPSPPIDRLRWAWSPLICSCPPGRWSCSS